MPPSPSRAVLLAHRDGRLAEEITDILLKEGLAVALSSDGHDAVAKILGRPFDAILADLFLPKLSGTAILQRVRMLGRNTPVVLVGKPLRNSRWLLDEARSKGACTTTDSTDARQLAKLLIQALASPPMPMDASAARPKGEAAGREATKPEAGRERRGGRRVPLAGIVHVQGPEGIRTVDAVDLSETGMYMAVEHPSPVGTPVSVKFALPGRTIPLLLRGKVVRARRSQVRGADCPAREGMAIRFADIDPAARSEIRDFVRGAAHRGVPAGAETPARGATPVGAPAAPDSERPEELATPTVSAKSVVGPRGTPTFQLDFSSYDAFLDEYSRNISHGGLFVPTRVALARNTRVAVEMRLPNNLGHVTVLGEVIRAAPPDPARSAPGGLFVQLPLNSLSGVRLLAKLASSARGRGGAP